MEEVWTDAVPERGFAKFGFWACVFNAWFCDLTLHIGMLDLSILRFGKSGIVLMPLGVVVFFDCFVLSMFGFQTEAHKNDVSEWPVILSWSVTTAVTLSLALAGVMEVFFLPLLGVPLAAFIYIGGCCIRDIYHAPKKSASNQFRGDPCISAMTDVSSLAAVEANERAREDVALP
jgi:hypothetical protein